MKKLLKRLLGLSFLSIGMASLAGCGKDPPPGSLQQTPLTMDQWQQLPPEERYNIDSLERLKLGQPRLRDQRVWEQFTRKVLLPGKRQAMLNERPSS